MIELIIPTILLAIPDAINPCEMAILILVLINILVNNPNDKKKVLKAGLSFCIAIFLMYFLYGVIIIQFFNTLDLFLSSLKIYIFKVAGFLAILLGILNIKDYIWYKPGGFATEMPLGIRPKAKMWVNKITNPKGAFLIGLFVSVFLLPCTMGPYIVLGNILYSLSFFKIFLLLLIYNLIFIFPMILITLLVYYGVSTLEDINLWKDRNIRYLHLTAGILLVIIGILIISGIIEKIRIL